MDESSGHFEAEKFSFENLSSFTHLTRFSINGVISQDDFCKICTTLTNLNELSILDGNLSYIPPQISLLKSLKSLNLSNNKILCFNPELVGMTSLSKLEMENNPCSKHGLGQDVQEWHHVLFCTRLKRDERNMEVPVEEESHLLDVVFCPLNVFEVFRDVAMSHSAFHMNKEEFASCAQRMSFYNFFHTLGEYEFSEDLDEKLDAKILLSGHFIDDIFTSAERKYALQKCPKYEIQKKDWRFYIPFNARSLYCANAGLQEVPSLEKYDQLSRLNLFGNDLDPAGIPSDVLTSKYEVLLLGCNKKLEKLRKFLGPGTGQSVWGGYTTKQVEKIQHCVLRQKTGVWIFIWIARKIGIGNNHVKLPLDIVKCIVDIEDKILLKELGNRH